MLQQTEMTGTPHQPLEKSIVLVGLMGVGKSCIGRLVAERVGLPFVDADTEIEAAAGCDIGDIFELHGEAAFRDGERRVIARLLDGPAKVLATGGGAFIDDSTRAKIRETAISVWLSADIDVLVARVSRRGNRPLLKNGDPRKVLEALMAERDPVYAAADIAVRGGDGPPRTTVNAVIEKLEQMLGYELVRPAKTRKKAPA